MEPIRMLYLSGKELEELGAMDMQLALEDVEEALKLVHLGEVILPSRNRPWPTSGPVPST